MPRLTALFLATTIAANFALVKIADARTPEQAKAACDARGPFYKLTPAHKAGDISPTSGKAYKKDSSGICRMNTAKVKEAISAGQIKPQ